MKATEVIKKADHLRNVEGKLKEAIEFLENSLSEVSREKEPAVLNRLANLYLDIGETDKSIRTLKKVIKFARKTGNCLIEADALRKLAYVIWKTEKNAKEATKLAEAALEITEERLGEKEFQKVGASVWATVGNVKFGSGAIQEASQAYKKGLKLAKASGYKERAVTILGDLGSVYLSQGKFNLAEKSFLKAARSAKTYYRHALPAVLLRLGYIFLSSKSPKRNLSRARSYFKKSIQIAKKEGWKREQADAYLALSKLTLEEGDLKKARDSLDKAISIYQFVKMPKLAKKAEVWHQSSN